MHYIGICQHATCYLENIIKQLRTEDGQFFCPLAISFVYSCRCHCTFSLHVMKIICLVLRHFVFVLLLFQYFMTHYFYYAIFGLLKRIFLTSGLRERAWYIWLSATNIRAHINGTTQQETQASKPDDRDLLRFSTKPKA
jgi:hypothetical protein